MMMRRIGRVSRQGAVLLTMATLAACTSTPPAPAPRPAPPPPPVALPPAPVQQDWRDVPLTPGRWFWHGVAGQSSIAQFGVPGQPIVFALRCDFATRAILFSRAGSLATPTAAMRFTTSFAPFSLTAGSGGGQPSAIVAQATARDPRMDQLAFSRGRFLVDVPGQPRLVLPAWPEVARVIEDCRF
ncbi:hypothetical protein [Sphingomonas oligoaromativorans]|uniref:hypothetical protein n=1 Tax=Sphingomonas oligoaromativorans TaxID=575322 RepID=UPI00141E5A77|nr:hypothetical protein [Sphingomonas oligoaromativorans]NIJ34032.1 hypothetical protein [Sphingomonas oligoaromativorans]